jgi:hypothetical protein
MMIGMMMSAVVMDEGEHHKSASSVKGLYN